MSQAASRSGMRRSARRGRHRKPAGSTVAARTAALTAGVAAAMIASTASPAVAASGDPWYRLRVCESGNNYRINTGNGFYGAYQFNLGTWRAYGGTGYPHQASPAEQDYRAKLLYRARGWSPWPACSSKLGLRNDPAYGRVAPVAVKPTISGPAGTFSGHRVAVRGTARKSALVRFYVRESYRDSFRYVRSVRANSAGKWATSFRLRMTTQYFVKADGQRSRTRTTRWLIPTSIKSPQSTALGGYQWITGRARPNRTVGVYFQSGSNPAFVVKRWVRADRYGRWAITWLTRTDYRILARGDVRSRVVRSRVTPALAAGSATLAADATATTIQGTARPRSTVVLYVRTPGGTPSAVGRAAVSSTGRFGVRFTPPAAPYEYFVQSSNMKRSRVHQVGA